MLITDLEDDAIREIANHIHDPTDFANFRASSKIIANITKFTGTIDERHYDYTHSRLVLGHPYSEFTFISAIVDGTKWFNFRHGRCKITFKFMFCDREVNFYIIETYHLNELMLVVSSKGKPIYRKMPGCTYIYRKFDGFIVKIYEDYTALRGKPKYTIDISRGTVKLDFGYIGLNRYSIIEKRNTPMNGECTTYIHYYGNNVSYILRDKTGQKVAENSANRLRTRCMERNYKDGKLWSIYKKDKVSKEYTIYNPETGQIIAHRLIYKGVLVKSHGYIWKY
jgi:hypothetical protein